MSVKVMNEVFDRYPNGGGEMLLALALADHAHDDGSHIFPSIKKLAEKTRQSERTVQYQLRKMQSMGWLILVSNEGGGRGRAREYAINRGWIKGANCAPFSQSQKKEKGEKSAPFNGMERVQILHPCTKKGCNSEQKRVQLTTEKGATAIAPEPSGTVKEPSSSTGGSKPTQRKPEYPQAFLDLWAAYPRRDGANPKRAAYQCWNARRREGYTPEQMLAGVQHYARWARAKGKEHTETVMQAKRFVGPDCYFLEPWKTPEDISHGQRSESGEGRAAVAAAIRNTGDHSWADDL